MSKDITVQEVWKWLDKLDKLNSEGTKVLHVENLLAKQRIQIFKEVREIVPKKKYKEIENSREFGGAAGSLYLELGYNEAIEDILKKLKELEERK